jgi:hypothetical protein
MNSQRLKTLYKVVCLVLVLLLVLGLVASIFVGN